MIRTIDLRHSLPTGPVFHDDAGSPRGAQQLLDPHAIAFITLVNDEAQYATCLQYIDALEIPSGYAVEKIAVFGANSMTEGCQRGMEASTAHYKIYVHQDVYLVHRGLLYEILHLFGTHPRLGMVGVVGATRLPGSAIWWLNNVLHSYGRIWEYFRPGGFPLSLLGPFNRRRLHFMRFRPFVGDYLPAVAVDGLFMATQYDKAWANSLGGFELYDEVQALEFIKAGLEVGIARQEAIWLLNWGPLQERPRDQLKHRDVDLFRRAAAFRQQNPAFIGVPARKLFEQYRGSRSFTTSEPESERLGVIIVTWNGREVLLRALRALWPQLESLTEVNCQVVVVDSASSDGTLEAVRREFPTVTVIANASTDGLGRAFNKGLRHLGFPKYVLVMHDATEFATGALVRMVGYLRDQQSVAGVSPSLVNPDGTTRFQRTAVVELVSRRSSRPRPITFVGTTCALVRGEVFFDVGLYDERFNACNEDLDWSLRARRKGYRFAFLPEARVVLHRSTGSQKNSPSVSGERLVAYLWLAHKHGGRRWAAVVYWAQRLLAGWLAFRLRKDAEPLRQLRQALAAVENLHRRIREENRLPQLL